MMRALLIGAAVALGVVLVVVGLVVSGVVDIQPEVKTPERVLVIATAPDDDGAQVAAFAFVLERDSASALVLDTMKSATIANTSAQNVREAYPFIGGIGAARVLSAQTAGEQLPWVVLPVSAWGGIVDRENGIEVDVPEGLSVYRDGKLVVLEPGEHKLEAGEVEALLSALDYLDGAAVKTAVTRQVAASVSSLLSVDRKALAEAAKSPGASTSLEPQELDAFVSAR